MKTKEETASERYDELGYDAMTFDDLSNKELWMEGYVRAMNDFQQEWIPVEVRLPEIEYDYLVTNGRAQMVAAFRTSTKTWDFWDNSSFWDNDEVTHWKPLPPLPQPYNPKQS